MRHSLLFWVAASVLCYVQATPVPVFETALLDSSFQFPIEVQGVPGVIKPGNAPEKITVKLPKGQYQLQKFKDQGGRGLTYTVIGGDSVGSFAKTNYNGKSEVDNTAAAGQLIDNGRDSNGVNPILAEWMIVKASPGKKITDTTAYTQAKGKKANCLAVLKQAVDNGHTALVNLWKTTGLNHNDISLDNVRFNDAVTQSYLIDFGEATKGPMWPDDVIIAALQAVFDPAELCPA